MSELVITRIPQFLDPWFVEIEQIWDEIEGAVNDIEDRVQDLEDELTGGVVTSVSKLSDSPIYGAVTLSSAGTLLLTEVGQNIQFDIATGAVLNTHIGSGAAIDFSKLAALTAGRILLGNGSNVVTATVVSGDITISSSGVVAIGANKVTRAMLAQGIACSVIGRSANSTGDDADIQAASNNTVLKRESDALVFSTIVDADVAVGAGIDVSKFADGSVSNAEFQRINSVTSNVQDQIDDKADNLISDAYSPTPGAVVPDDTLEEALEKIDGNFDAMFGGGWVETETPVTNYDPNFENYGLYRIIGDTADFKILLRPNNSVGNVNTNAVTITIPNNLKIDTNKLSADPLTKLSIIGTAMYGLKTGALDDKVRLDVIPVNDTQVVMYYAFNNIAIRPTTTNLDLDHYILMEFSIPVVGLISTKTSLNEWHTPLSGPTGSWSSNTIYSCKYRRVGDTAEFDIHIDLTGAPTAANLAITLPDSLNIDTAKLLGTEASEAVWVGYGHQVDVSANQKNSLAVRAISATQVGIFYNASTKYQNQVSNTAPFVAANTDYLNLRFTVPISGWAGGVDERLTTSWANTSVTPTGDWTVNTTYTSKYRRIGDMAEFQMRIDLTGAPNSATLSVNVPYPSKIDYNKLLGNGSSELILVGRGLIVDVSTGDQTDVAVCPTGINQLTLFPQAGNTEYSSNAPVTQAVPQTFANGDYIDITFRLPIIGWSGKGSQFPWGGIDGDIANQEDLQQALAAKVSANNTTLTGYLNVYHTATATSASSAGQTVIGVTNTGAARTITLQTADMANGRIMIIKDESGGAGTNNITVATQGSETIDGANTVDITVDYGCLRLYSNGSNWFSF